MSKAVSALNGAAFTGFCAVSELGPMGMITLRGDLNSAPVKKAVKAIIGTDVPAPLKINRDGPRAAAWMSPDELLLICDYDAADALVAKAQKSLEKSHAMVVNVSDARAYFRVAGKDARDVLAKLTPTDVTARAFGPGDFRRSRLAQVAGAFWMVDAETVEIVCFRSVARYVFDLLCDAAESHGRVA